MCGHIGMTSGSGRIARTSTCSRGRGIGHCPLLRRPFYRVEPCACVASSRAVRPRCAMAATGMGHMVIICARHDSKSATLDDARGTQNDKTPPCLSSKDIRHGVTRRSARASPSPCGEMPPPPAPPRAPRRLSCCTAALAAGMSTPARPRGLQGRRAERLRRGEAEG